MRPMFLKLGVLTQKELKRDHKVILRGLRYCHPSALTSELSGQRVVAVGQAPSSEGRILPAAAQKKGKVPGAPGQFVNEGCGKQQPPHSSARAASYSPHWPGMVNRGQWELRSAEPADGAVWLVLRTTQAVVLGVAQGTPEQQFQAVSRASHSGCCLGSPGQLALGITRAVADPGDCLSSGSVGSSRELLSSSRGVALGPAALATA
ncbi:hypothetical protein UY3_00289 [Chelonia mydas]|uniref:Uncharacterized protein n=1 Tax=Chelonia mydas TaxID=8469 RepID=M7C2Q1_CHEMY|nr:hypothetical protein UY3_00289 [Chelonia mydas]